MDLDLKIIMKHSFYFLEIGSYVALACLLFDCTDQNRL